MTRRRDVDRRLQSFDDIDKILRSMRNLSFLETRKLTQFLSSQRRVVMSMELAASDFLDAHPGLLIAPSQSRPVYVLVGSERGFCGDFNELLLRSLDTLLSDRHGTSPGLIPVGQKLSLALSGDPRLVTALDGPSTAEEVPGVLTTLTAAVNRLHAEYGDVTLTVIYHDTEADEVRSVSVLPPFRELPAVRHHAYPPRTTLRPETFLAELIDQYLFAVLYQVLYTSLMAEQQFRVRHLEGAMRRLEERIDELARERNKLRQEEIVEEIEVILLSAGDPG